MPELPEVEAYRRLAEDALERPIKAVHAPDAWFLKGATTARALRSALVGEVIVAARRRGKLLLLDVGDTAVLGVHFGMTGRLVVDERAGVDRLEYSSQRDEPAWDRFVLRFADGGQLRVNDARRLGGVHLDPDEEKLGPDALTLRPAELVGVLEGSAAPLKARLLDQSRIAGIGNLLGDEVLWRAGLDPARPAGSLSSTEMRRLHRHLVGTIEELSRRGGSHTGDLQAERHRLGVCPRDGTPLLRRTVGGRTTFSCPRHQK